MVYITLDELIVHFSIISEGSVDSPLIPFMVSVVAYEKTIKIPDYDVEERIVVLI